MRYWFASKKGWGTLLFPPVKIMKEKYPILEKAPVLCPVMWGHRLLTRGVGHLCRRDVDLTDYQISLEEKYMEANSGTGRLEMFRKLDLM